MIHARRFWRETYRANRAARRSPEDRVKLFMDPLSGFEILDFLDVLAFGHCRRLESHARSITSGGYELRPKDRPLASLELREKLIGAPLFKRRMDP